MTEVSSRNLQVRLLILLFLAFVPALGVFWYANRALRELQFDAKEQELGRRVQLVTSQYRHLVDQGETLLSTLAEFPEIETARSPTCNLQLARVLEHTSVFTTITVIGMDGYMACGALTPEGALYLGDRAYFVRATSRGIFSVGEFALGRITGKPVLGVARPLVEGDGTSPILGASIDLNVLRSQRGGDATLPAGHTLSVLSRDGQVMVRLPRTGNFTLADSVGAMAGPSFPTFPEGSGPEVVVGTDLDGVERLFAVAPLRSPDGSAQGYVAVGRTYPTLMQEVDEIVTLQLRFLAVGGIVLLVLAWALGHFWLARCPPEEREA